MIKLNISLKNGKTYKKELSVDESSKLYGMKIGDEFESLLVNIDAPSSFKIKGGSNKTGIPMRRDFFGQLKKRLLLTRGVGFKGKVSKKIGNKKVKKRFSGLRVKKSICGNTISDQIVQLNVKCIKGENEVEKLFLNLQKKTEETKQE